MRKIAISAALLGLALGGTLGATRAQADIDEQLTKVTFSAPVEIPGRVLLPGTYEFKVLDNTPTSQGNTVEILTGDGMHTIAVLHTIPVDRPDTNGRNMWFNGNTEVELEQRAPMAPPAIKEWFYAGYGRGHEFIYPSVNGNQNEPVLASNGK